MRMGIKKDFDWEYLGAVLAQDGDDTQAAFFKAFIKECKSWGTNHQVELQLSHINSLLTEDEKETLKMLSYTAGDD